MRTGHTADYEWSVEYRHVMAEISILSLEEADMVMLRIRIANLPPEFPERTLRVAMAQYGGIVSIHDETWSKAYRYNVANGINMVMMKLNKHFPSHMNIARHRILTSYDGQPVTCSGVVILDICIRHAQKGKKEERRHQIRPLIHGQMSLPEVHSNDVAPKRVERR